MKGSVSRKVKIEGALAHYRAAGGNNTDWHGNGQVRSEIASGSLISIIRQKGTSEMDLRTEDRYLPWILVLVLCAVVIVVYGRANHTEAQLRNEIRAYHACVTNVAGYSREMIEAQCLTDWMESRESLKSQPCYEDEPCWDCTTMGNRICGPR